MQPSLLLCCVVFVLSYLLDEVAGEHVEVEEEGPGVGGEVLQGGLHELILVGDGYEETVLLHGVVNEPEVAHDKDDGGEVQEASVVLVAPPLG
jgi:hypothetical protein